MRRLRPSTIIVLLSVLFLPLIQADNPSETRVERVGKAVSGAVESLSKKILNTTMTNATDEHPELSTMDDIPPSQGRAALDEARRAADQKSVTIPFHPQLCGSTCIELSNALLTAVEGPVCRTLFTTGKCPGNCMTEIAAITGNSSWAGCSLCSGDIVAGAGDRWAKLCGSRQESLIDAGKEAVKTLVGESFSARVRRRTLLQLFVGLLIFLVAAGYGYRRGRVVSLRVGKRRLRGRKNSDVTMPV